MSYIEIFHLRRDQIEMAVSLNSTGQEGQVAKAIFEIGLDNVHFENRDHPPLPDIPVTEEVRIGGGDLKHCLPDLLGQYQRGGFKNVTVDPTISYSYKNIL